MCIRDSTCTVSSYAGKRRTGVLIFFAYFVLAGATSKSILPRFTSARTMAVSYTHLSYMSELANTAASKLAVSENISVRSETKTLTKDVYKRQISRSVCEGFCVSKVSSPAFITPFRQVIFILDRKSVV